MCCSLESVHNYCKLYICIGVNSLNINLGYSFSTLLRERSLSELKQELLTRGLIDLVILCFQLALPLM